MARRHEHAPVRQRCSYVKAGFAFNVLKTTRTRQSFEAADRLAAALALGVLTFEVRACGLVVACLRDRNPVERGVELAVAAAVESVALAPA